MNGRQRHSDQSRTVNEGTTRPDRVETAARRNSTEHCEYQTKRKTEGVRQITLEETSHRNEGHWKRSFGETEIAIKASLLCETHTVDVSIEDTGSIFGKEVTRLSYSIF